MEKFVFPILITKPLIPDINIYFKYVKDIFDSKMLSNSGKYHLILEDDLKYILKVNNLLVFNNGTNALMIALKGLNLTGEIITTPFTFPATPHAITWNGLKPIFCDIDNKTMNIDANKIESYITKDTSAILAVHTFGTPCDVMKIEQIAKEHNLKVIYDSAHAFMTEIDGDGIGNFGDVSMFSFHPTKLFHTSEGGALTFNNDTLKETYKLLRNFGIVFKDGTESVELDGINGKMSEIQAAMGLCVLDIVDKERRKRESISKRYIHNLSVKKGISFQKLESNITPSYQYFPIRINKEEFGESRDDVYNRLREYNVFARKYFNPLCIDYDHYKDTKGDFSIARKVVTEVLCLPFYGDLTMNDINKICSIILGE
jgi:dTDP-4-amino-4,6-dideoxygalactose transaminase